MFHLLLEPDTEQNFDLNGNRKQKIYIPFFTFLKEDAFNFSISNWIKEK